MNPRSMESSRALACMWMCSLVSGASAASAGATPGFVVTDLGSLRDLTPSIPTNTTSAGNAINEVGVVAGGSSISGDCVGQTCEPVVPHAFRWQVGAMTDLGVIGRDAAPNAFPRPESIGWGINNFGQVVGEGTSLGNFNVRGWVNLPRPAYGLPAGMHELPLLHTSSRAYSVNDSGHIAGEATVPASAGRHAVIWSPAQTGWTITDIALPGWPSSFAYGINDHGEVTGTYSGGAPDNFVFAFLYLPAPAYGLPAGMHTITPQLSNAAGNAINDLGQIAGVGGSAQPMLWLPEAAYGLPAGVTLFALQSMFDAATLSANGFLFVHSAAFTGLNMSGVGVGNVTFGVQNPGGGIGLTTRGFVWMDGAFVLAQDLLPEGASWTRLNSAMAINNAGQIVGNGFLVGGDSHGYLLEPELCAVADLNCDGALDALDQALFCAAVGSSSGEPGYDANADLDEDGVIDQLDQALFNELVPSCVGDIVTSATFQPPADGMTDGADLAVLLGAWGDAPSCADFVSSATFAAPPDGIVDGADLAVLLGAWGRCP